MSDYNTENKEYDILCKEITTIREGLFTIKERMIHELNSDELRHMQYSLDEMQIDLKEKMIILKKSGIKQIII